MKKDYHKERLFFQRAGALALALSLSPVLYAADVNPAVGPKIQNEIMQEKKITGIVYDINGDPIPGASIIVKGTTIGTTSDMDGKYTIENVPSGSTLVFSFIGMQTQEVPVSNQSQINITMSEEAIGLNEVVAIGYGVARKSDVTGASSSLKSDEFVKRPITRIEQAMQGTAPGVQVVSSSGMPGKGLNVKIRGANSIKGGTEPLYVIDGQVGGDIASLNPNDIKSMEILKDASATAIYGSRGSNGVVLITTKSGEAGKTKINFNAWWSQSSIAKHLDLMDAYDFARVVNETNISTGGSAAFNETQLQEFKQWGGTDWHKEIEQKPWTQNYDLNMSGGSEAARYRLSFNYVNQPGLIINQYYKKANLRANLDLKPYKWLDVKVNLSYLQPQSRNTDYQGDLTDPFAQANIWDPTSLVRDPETGAYIKNSTYGSNGFNPVAQAESQLEDYTATLVTGMGQLTVHLPINGLTFTTTNSYTRNNTTKQSLRDSNTDEGMVNGARATVKSQKIISWQNSNYFTYQRTFDDHSLTAILLYEQSQYEEIWHQGEARNLSTESLGYYNLGLGASQQTTSGYTADALQSYMARVYYSFKEKYMVTASWRIDGSSRLTDKYSNFPSVALGWNIAKEKFLEDSPVISGLKIRASYGLTGNQAVGAFATIPRIKVDKPYFFDGVTSSVTTPLGAPTSSSLKWEKTKQTDIGIDASFFNGRLTFTMDLYNKDITDLLYQYDSPYYMGGESYDRNMGKLNNKGIELNIGGIPLSNKDFTWSTNLTFSLNRNKVVDLEGLDNVQVNNIGSAQSGISYLKVGRPLGEFYGYKFLGTWKSSEAEEAAKFGMKPGDARYEDVNGDHAYTSDDMQRIGNATPDFTFGFSNDLKYKNFTLNLMFYGSIGQDIYSQSMAYIWGGQGQAKSPTTMEALNMWTPEHETDNPHFSNTSKNFINSSRYVYNGSFVKLKNIALNYTVPQSITKKLFVDNLELYVSAQNLFTITSYPGYDPEVNNGTNALTQGLEMGVIPNPRSYTFGIRVGF